MKHLIILIFFLFPLSPAMAQDDREKESLANDSSVVIVYFDASVGRKPLEKAIRKTHSEVIYRYNNFNAYALKIPDESAKKKIEHTKGVLSVQDDRILELQDVRNQ